MKTIAKTRPKTPNKTQPKTQHISAWKWLLPLCAVFALGWMQLRPAPPTPAAVSSTNQIAGGQKQNISAQRTAWRVVREFPHDPTAFLQGLLWDNGGWYESTGLEGQSSLRRVEFPTGRVLKKVALPAQVFGEGLTAWNDELIQITWKSNVAYVWDKQTFRLKNQFAYQGEGWGITQDGQSLIMSDGSDALIYRDPKTFLPRRELKVTLNGRPQKHLNELEWVEGEIWANIWQTDLIARIDPQSGHIKSFLDLNDILPRELRTGREDVLNGIAYDKSQKRIWVSGKNWPRLFQIEVAE